MKTSRLLPATLVCLVAVAQHAYADTYGDKVLSLQPTHYFRLDEQTLRFDFDFNANNPDTFLADLGTNPVKPVHEGQGFVYDPTFPGTVGDGFGEVGWPGPDVDKDGRPFAGLGPDNRAIFNNNSMAVNLGPGRDFGNTTMTVAMFFKAPCNPDMPGQECTGPPASNGGERIFSNNFEGGNTGGTSDVDDLGHLQIDFGWGANLVVSIDNRFSEPLKSNFQVGHGDLVVKDNNWHHMVVSRNGDDLNNVILVVDGEEIVRSRWINSTDSWGVTAPFDARIGTRTTAPHAHTFNGWIDETAIWLGRQLTVEESICLYQSALGEPCDPVDAGPGDFNEDGTVDDEDYAAWQANFALAAGANRGLGDSDNDGDVDGKDFLAWQGGFGASTGVAAAAVPEPATAAVLLCLLAAGGNLARVRRP